LRNLTTARSHPVTGPRPNARRREDAQRPAPVQAHVVGAVEFAPDVVERHHLAVELADEHFAVAEPDTALLSMGVSILADSARSARDRMVWLSRRRPSLGAPEAFSFFAWPHSPNFMLQSGIWDRIRRRVDADLNSEVSVQCDLAIKQLLNLDREATFALLKGEHCLTLWPQQPEEDEREER